MSALHFYERRGLISSTRTAGNQRRYARDVLRRLAFIQAAQRVGVPLSQIAAALGTLPGGRTPTAHDWEKLSRQWQADLDARIATLTRLRDDLGSCIIRTASNSLKPGTPPDFSPSLLRSFASPAARIFCLSLRSGFIAQF